MSALFSTLNLATKLATPVAPVSARRMLKVTAWAGVDPVCTACGHPAVWRATVKATGEVVAGCADHKEKVRTDALARARAAAIGAALTVPKPKSTRIKVECLECRKKFTVSPTNVIPECPKCGGVDIDVRY